MKESVATDHGLKFPGARVTTDGVVIALAGTRDRGGAESRLFPILFHEWVGAAPTEYDILRHKCKGKSPPQSKTISAKIIRSNTISNASETIR